MCFHFYINSTVNLYLIHVCARTVQSCVCLFYSPSTIMQPTAIVLTKTPPILSLKILKPGSMNVLTEDVSLGDELILQMSSPGTPVLFLVKAAPVPKSINKVNKFDNNFVINIFFIQYKIACSPFKI